MLGLQGVLSAQYANGGVSQFIEPRDTYHGEITYNDDAMAHILRFWLDILDTTDEFFSVSSEMKESIEDSLIRAIDDILKTQIYSKEQQMRTVWCA